MNLHNVTMTNIFSACHQGAQTVLKAFKTIKKVKSWYHCKLECDKEEECQYFNFQVSQRTTMKFTDG